MRPGRETIQLQLPYPNIEQIFARETGRKRVVTIVLAVACGLLLVEGMKRARVSAWKLASEA